MPLSIQLAGTLQPQGQDGRSSDKQPAPCTSKQSTSTDQANQDLFPSSDVGFWGLAPNSYTANVSSNVNNLNVTKHKSVVNYNLSETVYFTLRNAFLRVKNLWSFSKNKFFLFLIGHKVSGPYLVWNLLCRPG